MRKYSTTMNSSESDGWSETSYPDAVKFDLPASDRELVDQVFNFLASNKNVEQGEMLLNMARKYRFAGYIGSIDFLFSEIYLLREEIKDIRENTWWNWFIKNVYFFYSSLKETKSKND